MKQITVELPEGDVPAFVAWLTTRGYGFSKPFDGVPEGHQAIVEQRLQHARPEDYQPWDAAFERLKARRAR